MPVKIVILGGGFGGIYTMLSLRKHMKKIPYTLTIISDKEYFSFTPFLSEVAGDIIHPIEAMTYIKYLVKQGKETYIHRKAIKIDLESKIVYTTHDGEYPYDYLVIAIGATNNFMNIPGAQEFTLGLKNVGDANHIRRHIDMVFEEAIAKENNDERRHILTFAIIGSGPTGIEIAGDIEEYTSYLVQTTYPSIEKTDVCVMLISSSSEVAKEFDQKLRERAAELIQKENIQLKLNAKVKEFQQDTIILNDDSRIYAHTIIWAAGVKANSVLLNPDDVIDHNYQKFLVDPYLRLSKFPEVFAIGDVAMFSDETRKLPMLAQSAVSEGLRTGKNIEHAIMKKSLHTYTYHSKGELIAIGKGAGIATIYGIDISGKLAWFIWRMIYLYKYIDTKKKPLILYHWVLELFHRV